MKTKKIFALIALNVLLLLVLQASMNNVIAKPQGIVLQGITRHNSVMYGAYESAFLAQNPDVDDIIWLEISKQSEWITAINSPSYSIDILWGGGPTIFNIVADAGYMLPFQDPALIDYIETNISKTIAGGDMYRQEANGDIMWVGAAISSFGFTVNHDNLAAYGLPVPRSWEELASTEYFLGTNTHAIGMGDAPETTSNTRVYQIILQKFGWEAGWDILTRMAGNSKIFDSSDNTRDSAITGSQALAMTIDFYGYQAEQQNPACEYIIPQDET
ncbi:MAG: ABC transporter substrate-binding protein, partial [Candidatus Hodarchaeales archaeon]